jgi:hypothetical protein
MVAEILEWLGIESDEEGEDVIARVNCVKALVQNGNSLDEAFELVSEFGAEFCQRYMNGDAVEGEDFE